MVEGIGKTYPGEGVLVVRVKELKGGRAEKN